MALQTQEDATLNTSGFFIKSDLYNRDVNDLQTQIDALGANPTTTLTVAKGGTGATTLTGLVKGNGTSAFTAAVAGTDYLAPLPVGTVVMNVSATVSGQTYGTWTNIGSQSIGTGTPVTVYYYQRTA